MAKNILKRELPENFQKTDKVGTKRVKGYNYAASRKRHITCVSDTK